MTANRIHRTIRISVLSTVLALVAFLFLAFGSASAHTLNHATPAARAAGSGTMTVARIVLDRSNRSVFNPGTITVKAGNFVKIVNKTAYNRIIFDPNFVDLAPGASVMIAPTQSETVNICGGGALTINVV